MQSRKKYLLSLALVLLSIAGTGAYLLNSRHQAQYCWLQFGPESKLRILVRVDAYGNQITLTHYLDGQPTGRVEQFPQFSKCNNVSIDDPDGKTSYLLTKTGRTCTHQPGELTEIFFHFDINGPFQYKQYCDVVAKPVDPASAPLAHFHGPLTVKELMLGDPADWVLKRGQQPTRLSAILGTFDATKGCWVIVRLQDEQTRQPLYPGKTYPVVDVEFPSSTDREGAPLKRRYPLTGIAGGVMFQGPIPLPDEAANGTAKLCFSFDRWKPTKVASSIAEFPVVDEKPDTTPQPRGK